MAKICNMRNADFFCVSTGQLKRLMRFAAVASPPGKVAPVTAGRLIAETVLNILSEGGAYDQ